MEIVVNGQQDLEEDIWVVNELIEGMNESLKAISTLLKKKTDFETAREKSILRRTELTHLARTLLSEENVQKADRAILLEELEKLPLSKFKERYTIKKKIKEINESLDDIKRFKKSTMDELSILSNIDSNNKKEAYAKELSTEIVNAVRLLTEQISDYRNTRKEFYALYFISLPEINLADLMERDENGALTIKTDLIAPVTPVNIIPTCKGDEFEIDGVYYWLEEC